jgi:hypothetical protein
VHQGSERAGAAALGETTERTPRVRRLGHARLRAVAGGERGA